MKRFLRAIFNVFRKNNERRRSYRQPIHVDTLYFSQAEHAVSGQATVLNVNRGGVCLSCDNQVLPDTLVGLKINPHTISTFIDFKKVMVDEAGRYVIKIVWVKTKDGHPGVVAGGVFLEKDGSPYLP